MPLLKNIHKLYTCEREGGQAAVHEISAGAIVWEGSLIRWVGKEEDVPGEYARMEQLDAEGAIVIPGLVDCHTHVAFAGWRADEFEARILGRDYLEVARKGGGIASTMRATREASEQTLYDRTRGFLHKMSRLGVTTVEGKSGYGLTVEDELKTLRVYERLNRSQPVHIVSTFLGAHIVPPEYQTDRAGYIRLLTDQLIPEIARQKLAAFCDVFVEETAFTIDEARHILTVASAHGLRPKLHADQLQDGGGAALAAEVGAVSADHLEYSSDEGIGMMARSGVVAVSLPLATLYLDQRPMPARKFITAGVHVAVATDFNPGSAPSYHLPLAMTLACTMQRMTPAEVLKGATLYAARAIGVEARVGSLETGKQADFVLLDAESVNHWLYHFRPDASIRTFIKGEPHAASANL